jgi:hypothetical protein
LRTLAPENNWEIGRPKILALNEEAVISYKIMLKSLQATIKKSPGLKVKSKKAELTVFT